MTHAIFQDLCVNARKNHILSDVCEKHAARPRFPVEALLMASLWVLAQAGSFLQVEFHFHISQATALKWHTEWMKHMVDTMFKQWVELPSGLQLQQVCAVYELHGHPGCMGSTDGVHREWGRVPFKLRALFTGKEKLPTVVFNVTCDHARRVLHVSGPYPGARNDKTIARTDALFEELRTGPWRDVVFKLYNADGTTTKMKGLYVLVDGGYHRWRFLQCPLPNSDTWGKRMSGRLESTRKDAECTFGIMKRRFKTLKRPSEYLEMQDVGNEFKVCAILHNMLLQTDGLSSLGRKKSHWIVHKKGHTPSHCGDVYNTNANNSPESPDQVSPDQVNETDVEEDPNFYTLREKLLVDFKYRWEKRKLRWCHPFKKIRERERCQDQDQDGEEEELQRMEGRSESAHAGWFVPQSTGILCEVNALEGELPGDWYGDVWDEGEGEGDSEGGGEEEENEGEGDDDIDGWF